MKGWKMILGIVLWALLLTTISWAVENVEVFQGDNSQITSCWKQELAPIYLCINTLTETTRFANWTNSFEDRQYHPACRRNETLIEAFVIIKKSHFIDFGDPQGN